MRQDIGRTVGGGGGNTETRREAGSLRQELKFQLYANYVGELGGRS